MATADVVTMSAKKDANASIGGFIACRDRALAERIRNLAILYEGYPTYGGLAGRDLEAIAIGLREILDPDLLGHRIHQVRGLAHGLQEAEVPVVLPTGGHAVYLDAGAMLPHIPRGLFPAQALACELYAVGGIRGCEVGTLLNGRDPDTGENRWAATELVHLAVPRRTYTARQLRIAVDAVAEIMDRRDPVPGLRLVHEPAVLRHFTARFEALPVANRLTA
jgi:tryptophanase